MRSRWYHPPRMHTHHDGERRVGWLELFYDLVFVAAAIQLGDALSAQVTATHSVLGPLSAFGGYFTMLFWAWSGFTFYANRYELDDFAHRGLVFLNMLCLGIMAIVAPAAMQGHGTAGFAGALAMAQSLVALMYWRSWRQEPRGREWSAYTGTVTFASAVLFWVSVAAPEPWRYGLWAAGILVSMGTAMTRRSVELYRSFPVDMEHLGERFGLLVIIVLGESFVKVLSYLSGSGHATEPSYIATSLLPLLVTFNIWWIYFDDIAGNPVRDKLGAETTWMAGHLPLALGITAMGVGLKKLVGVDFEGIAPLEYRMLLGVALGTTFVSVALIDAVSERANAVLSDRMRVVSRLVAAALVVLAAAVGDTMSAGAFVATVVAICLSQVVFDVLMAPFEEGEEDQIRVTGTAVLQRMREVTGSGQADSEKILAGTVRLNVPEGMRQDLYLFFMEGPWSQLLIAAVAGFFLTNLGFAGLYMLQPDAIGGQGAQDFGDAFAFSVQTLTTIGYGAMSPGSSYGDFLVAIESLVGILGVAVLTGIVFAKASRPVSGVLFSDVAVITSWRGQRTLMVRVGNVHGRDVVDTRIQIAAVLDEVSEEGHHFARNHYLKLVNDQLPLFITAFTAMHVIDEHSPLHGLQGEALAARMRLLIATLHGHDARNGSTVSGRGMYPPDRVSDGFHFVDASGATEDGRLVIDFAKLSAVEADG
ncbi:MAG: low temperature requirement protein A [Alphaproteobacteria bacterium]|nr:low temperature requirement protein A [Alphaproteobacteria bacterium]